MTRLMRTLGELKLSPAHVVQIKVFLKPATAAEEVLGALKTVLPGPDHSAGGVRGMDFPIAGRDRDDRVLAPVGQAGSERGILQSARPAACAFLQPRGTGPHRSADLRFRPVCRAEGKGEAQATDVFEQLKAILDQAGGDMLHLAKATYYVCDDDSARGA